MFNPIGLPVVLPSFDTQVDEIVTGIFDSRTAVLSLGVLVVIGAILLQKVDVEEGIRVAKEEDERLSSESSVE